MTLRRGLALATIALLAASAARAASPLDDLIARKPANNACFNRVYDADHLRKNPKQTTTSMAVWLAYDRPRAIRRCSLRRTLALPSAGVGIPRRCSRRAGAPGMKASIGTPPTDA